MNGELHGRKALLKKTIYLDDMQKSNINIFLSDDTTELGELCISPLTSNQSINLWPLQEVGQSQETYFRIS